MYAKRDYTIGTENDSPDLNSIEILWKHLKKIVCANNSTIKPNLKKQ